MHFSDAAFDLFYFVFPFSSFPASFMFHVSFQMYLYTGIDRCVLRERMITFDCSFYWSTYLNFVYSTQYCWIFVLVKLKKRRLQYKQVIK